MLELDIIDINLLFRVLLNIYIMISLITCNIGFSLLSLFLIQSHKGYLSCLHINPMDRVNDSCQYSEGTVRPYPGIHVPKK